MWGLFISWLLRWYNIIMLVDFVLLLIVNSPIFDWVFNKVWNWRNRDLLDWIDRNDDRDV